jgi:hypothetical protein
VRADAQFKTLGQSITPFARDNKSLSVKSPPKGLSSAFLLQRNVMNAAIALVHLGWSLKQEGKAAPIANGLIRPYPTGCR